VWKTTPENCGKQGKNSASLPVENSRITEFVKRLKVERFEGRRKGESTSKGSKNQEGHDVSCPYN
jgi:hypothetical protein